MTTVKSADRWFHCRATSYVECQVLFHLNQVGVLSLLGEGGSHTALEIAGSLGLAVDTTGTLLEYVFQVDELLDRDLCGRYSLSAFGRDIVERFSRAESDGVGMSINMFDVRVGAYGPVWQSLGALLRGEQRYGLELKRDGRFAEDAVSKIAPRFWRSLTEHIDDLAATSVVEVGVVPGMLERLGAHYPDGRLYGLDRSHAAIERAVGSLSERAVARVEWLPFDFLDVPAWSKTLDPSSPGLVYSLHLHELLAAGEAALEGALREVQARLPNWALLALEQPRLGQSDKALVSETEWLYSQANVLIHHLIGNGRILSREAWLELGRRAGCREVTDSACGYLGYRAFLFRF